MISALLSFKMYLPIFPDFWYAIGLLQFMTVSEIPMHLEIDDPASNAPTVSDKHSQWWFYPWLIWGLGAAFFFSEYLGRVAPSVVQPELMQAFHINATSFGTLGAMFLIPYIVMQMPVGMLVDRYGPHKLLTVTCALCALGCYLFGSAHTLYMASVGRFLMGFASAFAFVGALKLATLWFCPSRFGLLAGLTQALGMFGAALGEGPLAIVVEHLGWRQSMFIIGTILLVLAVLIGLIVRDHPLNKNEPSEQPSEQLSRHISFWNALMTVLRNPQTWINGVYVGCVYAPTGVFAELWGVSYLVQHNGLSRSLAAEAVSMIFIGWAVGGPLAGMFSDKIRRRTPVMFASAVLSTIFLCAVLYIPDLSAPLLFLLLFLFGLSNTGVGVSYAVAGEINPRIVAGTSIAFANMASILIAAILQPIVGRVLDLSWDGTMSNGIKVYSVTGYQEAMLSLPICLVIGVLFSLLVKETHCKLVEPSDS